MDEDTQDCPVCGVRMDPFGAWWWTDSGPACSEECAQVLAREES